MRGLPPPKIPKAFAADALELPISEMCLKYGISPKTCLNWRNRLGIKRPRSNAIDHSRLIDLINQRHSTREIVAIMGCHKSTVNDQKRKMGIGANAVEHHYKTEPCVPLADRPRLAIEAKLKRMSAAQRAAWVGGVAYQQTLEGLNV